jgi:hypothetical protein
VPSRRSLSRKPVTWSAFNWNPMIYVYMPPHTPVDPVNVNFLKLRLANALQNFRKFHIPAIMLRFYLSIWYYLNNFRVSYKLNISINFSNIIVILLFSSMSELT